MRDIPAPYLVATGAVSAMSPHPWSPRVLSLPYLAGASVITRRITVQDAVDFRRIKSNQSWFTHYLGQHLYAPFAYALVRLDIVCHLTWGVCVVHALPRPAPVRALRIRLATSGHCLSYAMPFLPG